MIIFKINMKNYSLIRKKRFLDYLYYNFIIWVGRKELEVIVNIYNYFVFF